MPSRFDEPPLDPIDLDQAYDIYVNETPNGLVVYRNAMFRSMRGLAEKGRFDVGSQFIEIQQTNGDSVYLRRHSIVKFCRPGNELTMERVPEY